MSRVGEPDLESVKRIGIMGGTFDPVHMGHLAVAAAAIQSLGLDQVLFVVAHRPWQKVDKREVTNSELRLKMVQAAVSDRDDMTASRIEIDRGGTTYSIDTVEELQRADPSTDFWLLLGTDVVAKLNTWHRHEDLAAKVRLAVFDRPGSIGIRPGSQWRYDLVDAPLIDISSTTLRDRLSAGLSVEYLVPLSALEVRKREAGDTLAPKA